FLSLGVWAVQYFFSLLGILAKKYARRFFFMPHCEDCGNSLYFIASSVSPVAPSAAGAASGLAGRFDARGKLVELDSLGSTAETRRKAAANPVLYFDTCMECGSNRVVW
ncbi:MAG: hypothetical protein AAGU23_06120, partial [Bacillota bacterium]